MIYFRFAMDRPMLAAAYRGGNDRSVPLLATAASSSGWSWKAFFPKAQTAKYRAGYYIGIV